MKLLEERILTDGVVKEGNILKVDRFLNHQMDPALFLEMAKEWKRLYEGCPVNKILTIEASGIGIACITAQVFGCPVVFAKKTKTKNIASDVYTASVMSYTTGNTYDVIVSREFLLPTDRLLLIDDFLANGAALDGLLEFSRQAGAEVIGAGIAIEKAFQRGGERLRRAGLRIESLARIQSMEGRRIVFCDD